MDKPQRPMSETALIEACAAALRRRLPEGWQIEAEFTMPGGTFRTDSVMRIQSPDGQSATFILEVKSSLPARIVLERLQQKKQESNSTQGDVPIVVVTSFISPWMQDQLELEGFGWLDATGNVRLASATPALFISNQGAKRDPWPDDVPLRSLKGRGASAAVRALVDYQPPVGLVDLAKVAKVAPATLSRVVNLLEDEGLINRLNRGGIQSVNWAGVIRRWSIDLTADSPTERFATFLEPRGIDAVIAKLQTAKSNYVVTGSFAASYFTQVAPTRQLSLYVDDLDGAVEELELRTAGEVGNVRILTPYDPVVFERSLQMDGIRIAALGQVAVDLMSGPGREPAEGEALMNWMEENTVVWRSTP